VYVCIHTSRLVHRQMAVKVCTALDNPSLQQQPKFLSLVLMHHDASKVPEVNYPAVFISVWVVTHHQTMIQIFQVLTKNMNAWLIYCVDRVRVPLTFFCCSCCLPNCFCHLRNCRCRSLEKMEHYTCIKQHTLLVYFTRNSDRCLAALLNQTNRRIITTFLCSSVSSTEPAY